MCTRLREEDDEVRRGTAIERRVSSCRGLVGYKLPIEHDDETLEERKKLNTSKETEGYKTTNSVLSYYGCDLSTPSNNRYE